MTYLLSIDPGNIESAWTVIDRETLRPVQHGKTDNEEFLAMLGQGLAGVDGVAIELIASYGMPVGREVFDTCIWIGRFIQLLQDLYQLGARLVFRLDVKVHLTHSAKAKDSNVTQALVDRFTPGQPNHGKGTKAKPGWFHGFKADVWAAYAVGVYVLDQEKALES